MAVHYLSTAIRFGHLSVVEWWHRHKHQLSPQDLYCSSHLIRFVRLDAVDVLAWWHTYGLPLSESDWQLLYYLALIENALNTQLWLLDHVSDRFSLAEYQGDDEFYNQMWEYEIVTVAPFSLEYGHLDTCSTAEPDFTASTFRVRVRDGVTLVLRFPSASHRVLDATAADGLVGVAWGR
ncbi:hypothetical protein BC828DRAFT_392761 [Blastocladiella britannica]|nr:hypothetical protein BC828DRAFT_392761 [Blastocladiella britannica]